MDIATIIGLVGGTTLVCLAIVTGGSVVIFLNIPGILIVVGGTIATCFIKFTMVDVINSVRVAMKAFIVNLIGKSGQNFNKIWLYTKLKLPLNRFIWKRLSAAAFDFAVENRSHIPCTCSFYITQLENSKHMIYLHLCQLTESPTDKLSRSVAAQLK